MRAVGDRGGTVGPAARLPNAVGDDRVLSQPARLRTDESDGLANLRMTPGTVVLVHSEQHVLDPVRPCAKAGVPFVARGSGTGLSGAALPATDRLLVVSHTPCRCSTHRSTAFRSDVFSLTRWTDPGPPAMHSRRTAASTR